MNPLLSCESLWHQARLMQYGLPLDEFGKTWDSFWNATWGQPSLQWVGIPWFPLEHRSAEGRGSKVGSWWQFWKQFFSWIFLETCMSQSDPPSLQLLNREARTVALCLAVQLHWQMLLEDWAVCLHFCSWLLLVAMVDSMFLSIIWPGVACLRWLSNFIEQLSSTEQD